MRSPLPSGTRKKATEVPFLYVNSIAPSRRSGTSLNVVPTSKFGLVLEQNSSGSVHPTPSKSLQNSLSTVGKAMAMSPAFRTWVIQTLKYDTASWDEIASHTCARVVASHSEGGGKSPVFHVNTPSEFSKHAPSVKNVTLIVVSLIISK